MGKLTGSKCFSILVAAGHGQRCNALRGAIRDATLCRGPEGEIDAVLWRDRELDPAAYLRVSLVVSRVVRPFLADVPPHVLGPDGRDWRLRNVN